MTRLRQTDMRGRRKRGDALVESAFVLLILMALIMGILDCGQMFFFLQTFTERSHAGVRYAITHGYDPATITNVILYNSATAPGGSPPGLFGLTASEITVNRYNAGDAINDRIEVVISNVPLAFYSPYLRRSYTPRPFRVVRSVEGLGVTN